MVVGAGDYRQIEAVGEMKDGTLVTLHHVDSLGCAVRQLHRPHSRDALYLVRWQRRHVARDGEHQHGCALTVDRRTATHRVMPLALGIEHGARIDPNRDDVLVMVPRLDRRKQDRHTAPGLRIGCKTP